VLHADRFVQPDRRLVLRPDEEADGRNPLEEQATEIREAASTMPEASSRRIDPHLCQLHRLGRPCGRLGLEENDVVLDPEPGAPFLDLTSGSPAKALGISLHRVDVELQLVGRRTRGHEELEVIERRGAQTRVSDRRGPVDGKYGLPGTILARRRQMRPHLVPQLGDGTRFPDQHARCGSDDIARKDTTAVARGHHVDSHVAEGNQFFAVGPCNEAAVTTPRDVLEEDSLDRVQRAETQDLVTLRLDELYRQVRNSRDGSLRPAGSGIRRVKPVPIHLRAESGDYADACLLPGDPLRAKYIAETFLTDVVQVNSERGLLGYTGKWDGKPVSVQGTGMGCPSATIVFEELVQLGVTRLLRVGTCGGLQPDTALGDLIVALSAVPSDATASHLVGGEPHCPTASWELIHEAVHVAKHTDQPLRVGPIVSTDLFYNPDEGQYERWSKRGILAVEMEAAALFTVAAVRGVHGGCLLTVSDIVIEGEFVRISDDELRAAVDRMTRIALDTATAAHDGH